MEIKQKLELRKLLAPEMRQSLTILALPLLDLKSIAEEELLSNPLLEEVQGNKEPLQKSEENPLDTADDLPPADFSDDEVLIKQDKKDKDGILQNIIAKKLSLQDILLRQLGMFARSDNELLIGQEIIGNIDDNGYLKTSCEEIASQTKTTVANVEKILALIHQFEPAGVGARNIEECLLIQLKLANEQDPLLEKLVCFHLDDIAKKNFSKISASLKEPLEKIKSLIQRITRLDPKPGRNYTAEDIHQVVPDIVIEIKGAELEITINNETIPRLFINKTYRDMLKKDSLDDATREFLSNKLKRAYELVRSISRRQSTLRLVVEAVAEIQKEAIINDLALLKPLTFKDIAAIIHMHETTVCRVVMNKYVQLPYGIVAFKDFFPRRLQNNTQTGEDVSSELIKSMIKEYIDAEDKRRPLSDQEIAHIIKKERNMPVARRTINKYREEMKILSSTYRKER